MRGLCRNQETFDLEGPDYVILECEKRSGHKKQHAARWTQGNERGTVFSIRVKWRDGKHVK